MNIGGMNYNRQQTALHIYYDVPLPVAAVQSSGDYPAEAETGQRGSKGIPAERTPQMPKLP